MMLTAGVCVVVCSHYLRLGPHTLLTFLFWEQIKKAAERAGI